MFFVGFGFRRAGVRAWFERLAQAAIDPDRHIAIDGGAAHDSWGVAIIVNRDVLRGAVIPDHHVAFLPAPAHGVIDMGNTVVKQTNQLF